MRGERGTVNEYVVEIEFGVEASEEHGISIVEAFLDYDGIGTVSDHGNAEVMASIPAETLAAAIRLALDAAEAVRAGEPIAFSVVQAAEWDFRQGFDGESIIDVMSVTEVAHRLGVTRQRVHQLVGEERIPARRVGHSVVISESAVTAFEASRKPVRAG